MKKKLFNILPALELRSGYAHLGSVRIYNLLLASTNTIVLCRIVPGVRVHEIRFLALFSAATTLRFVFR